MLWLFDSLKGQIKPKVDSICIDNWAFKLHYRLTTIFFFIATILVTSREYIGEHIKCISDMDIPGFDKVIETFCFFTTTFTVVEDSDNLYDSGYINHRGVLPFGMGSKQEVRKHMYYQWVPFLLFGQAIMFYLPHILWKKMEGDRIRKLVAGLHFSKYSVLDDEVEIEGQIIPTREKKSSYIRKMKEVLMKGISLNKTWAQWFMFFEILNTVHVVLQFFIIDKFLGNNFASLGPNVVYNTSKILDEIFPKVTKCTFYKYGPSGSIQIHDALCVMALNIINEKIYVFLWFWFVILFAFSCVNLIWRFVTVCLYSRSIFFNQLVFGHASQNKIDPWHMRMVIRHCDYFDWLMLKYLSKNMDGLAFRELFGNIYEDLEERKPLFMVQGGKSFMELNKFE